MKANRELKNSLFSFLFSDIEVLRELYSALEGVSLPPDTRIDIVGAGDACSSGIVTALCSGASPQEAAFVGNLVAGNTIQVIGTTGVATQCQVLALYAGYFTG
jgi:sugar/nucleoside kinase (ribokinase family)